MEPIQADCEHQDSWSQCTTCSKRMCYDCFRVHAQQGHTTYTFSTPNISVQMRTPNCAGCHESNINQLYYIHSRLEMPVVCAICLSSKADCQEHQKEKQPLVLRAGELYFRLQPSCVVLVSPACWSVDEDTIRKHFRLGQDVWMEDVSMGCMMIKAYKQQELPNGPQANEAMPENLVFLRQRRKITFITEKAFLELDQLRKTDNELLMQNLQGISNKCRTRIINEALVEETTMLVNKIKSMYDAAQQGWISCEQIQQFLRLFSDVFEALRRWDQDLKFYNYPACQDVGQEIRIFCFGNRPDPLPIYHLREEMREPHDYGLVTMFSGSGKTALMPIMLIQGGYTKITFVTQSNEQLVDEVYRTYKALVTQNTVVARIDKNLKFPLHQKILIVCTPIQLAKLICLNKNLLDRSRFIIDDCHNRTADFEILFSILQSNINLKRTFHLTFMSATPNMIITKILPMVKCFDCNHYIPTLPNKIHIFNIDDPFSAPVQKPVEIVIDCLKMIIGGKMNIGHMLIYTDHHQSCHDIEQRLFDTNFDGKSNYIVVSSKQFQIDVNQTTKSMHNLLTDFVQQNSNKIIIITICLTQYGSNFEKQAVNDILPKNVIKIIITSDNVHTSTIYPSLIAIIDSGVIRQEYYNYQYGITKYMLKFLNKSQRQQRLDKILRSSNCVAFVIYLADSTRERDYQQVNEIKRVDLSKILLEFKAINVNCNDFFQHCMTQPSNNQIQYATSFLQNIKAIDAQSQITQRGQKIAKFKFNSPLESMLITVFQDQMNVNYMIQAVMVFSLSKINFLLYNDLQICQNNYCQESDIVTLIKTFFDVYNLNLSTNEFSIFCEKNGIIERQYNYAVQVLQETYIVAMSNLIIIDENSDDFDHKIKCQIISDFNRVQNDLLELTDGVIKAYFNLCSQYLPETAVKNVAEFNTLVNIDENPAYYFRTTQEVTILANKRLGGKSLECYKTVYFLNVTQQEDSTCLIGHLMHRVPHITNYLKCRTLNCINNVNSLPFINNIFTIFFKDSILTKIQQNIDANVDKELQKYILLNQQGLSLCLKHKLTNSGTLNEEFQLQTIIAKLIELTCQLPQSFLKMDPEMPGKVVEITAENQKTAVKFYDVDELNAGGLPRAYRFDQNVILLLLQKPNMKYRVALTFADKITDQNNFDITSKSPHVFQTVGGAPLNQFVLLTDHSLKSANITQLQWNAIQTESKIIHKVSHKAAHLGKANTENAIQGLCEQCKFSDKVIPTVDNDLKTTVLVPFCTNCVTELLAAQPQLQLNFLPNSTTLQGPAVAAFMMSGGALCQEVTDKIIKIIATQKAKKFRFCTYCDEIVGDCGDVSGGKFEKLCKKCQRCLCNECGEWHRQDEACDVNSDEKHCPRCKIPVFKESGCDYIACSCGAHWCYACESQETTFDTSDQVFEHIKAVHEPIL